MHVIITLLTLTILPFTLAQTIMKFSGINNPNGIFKELPKINITLAQNFSFIPWGSSLTGFVKISSNVTACTPLDPIEMPESQKQFILYVDRGDCTFVTKAFNAQNVGAQMVIIGNNLYAEDEDFSRDIIIDDQSGRKINIPTALIKKSDGTILKRFLQNKQKKIADNIWATIKFKLPKTIENGDMTEMEYWISAGDKSTYKFASDFYAYMGRLNQQQVNITPHYTTWFKSGSKFTFSSDNCISNQKYCATTIVDGTSRVNGKFVLYEQLRQICIFKSTNLDTWFEYMIMFDNLCFQEGNINFKEDCSINAMSQIGIDTNLIMKCFLDSADIDTKGAPKTFNDVTLASNNFLLKEEYNARIHDRNIQLIPQVVLDGANYQGRLEAEFVFDTICMSTPSNCIAMEDAWQHTDPNHEDDYRSQYSLYFFTLIAICLLIALVTYCYKRSIRLQMNQQMEVNISDAVSQYFALNNLTLPEKA